MSSYTCKATLPLKLIDQLKHTKFSNQIQHKQNPTSMKYETNINAEQHLGNENQKSVQMAQNQTRNVHSRNHRDRNRRR